MVSLAPLQRFYGRLIESAAIFSTWETKAGQFPVLTAKELRDFYLTDVDSYAGVSYLTNRSNMDIFLKGDEDYKNGRALELARDFVKNVKWGRARSARGLKGLNYYIFQEMMWAGTPAVQMITSKNADPDDTPMKPNELRLHRLQATSLQKFVPTESGDLDHIHVQLSGGKSYDLDGEEVTVFPFNSVDSSLFGYSLIHPLAVTTFDTYNKVVPAPLVTKRQIVQDLRRYIHRRGTPRMLYNAPGAKADDVDKYSEKFSDLEADASVVSNFQKLDVMADQVEEAGGSGTRLKTILDYFYRQTQTGLQTPINMLVSDPGRFSEASARVSAELSDVLIDHNHNVNGNAVKYEWIDRYLEMNGFDCEKADIEVLYGEPETQDIVVTDILSLGNLSFQRESKGLQPLIHPNELRDLFRNSGYTLSMDDAELAKLITPVPAPAPNPFQTGGGQPPAPEDPNKAKEPGVTA